ncbi:CBS domain-containing protein [Paraliomyxa miuraensis]|uniref:CBS domain-containing protein n=1 Tax=Paraliomyxa miuraensis TaxID=376150 RepID=UPI00225019B0|nr:CBS domain-containing protein [Paraliomyxa miuraensis]
MPGMLKMNVGAVCTREVVIAAGDDTVLEIAGLMRTHHVGDVVIVERSSGASLPTGILTDRDLVLEAMAQASDRLPDLVAADLVTRPLVTVRECDTIDDALEVMRVQGVRRVPVVDEAGLLVGLLALDDLLELFASQLASVAALVIRQQRMERERRK